MDALIITDRYETPVVAEQRTDGGVVLRGPRKLYCSQPSRTRPASFLCGTNRA